VRNIPKVLNNSLEWYVVTWMSLIGSRKCENCYYKPIDMVEDDLFINGIDMNYTQWVFHGEEDLFRINEHVNHNDDNASSEDIDEVEQKLNDIGMGTFPTTNAGESSTTPGLTTNDYEPRTFDQVLEDA